MEIVKEKAQIRKIVQEASATGRTVGLVPTMGFFHQGHLELMRRARADCDLVVVTLFVNPTQFTPGEDFADYPRDFERDREMAESVGVDYIFNPEVDEMYPEGFSTHVEVEGLSDILCGAIRPGHFRGVATVVAKLFNIVPAKRAYFGQKDAQQLAVIKRMAADLDFPLEVIGVATVREEDGLAMSSRNTYLGEQDRADALVLSRALSVAAGMIDAGERSAAAVSKAMQGVFNALPSVNLEYIAICDNIYLRPLSELRGEVLIAVAARVGKARLIDNMLFEVE
ncbi:MAG TPA: pantoate--beta-alanine ligase [Candidatus Anoxymicrobiaceae bacterium]|jgi:pantoate--beta-alanine ligase